MKPTMIRVADVSKSYVIRHQAAAKRDHTTLREDLTNSFKRLFHRTSQGAFQTKETFWALRDISFEIQEGDSIGFIGHNGAGKSTLLKVLSRITDPTTGEMEINGRVASLLEVATGFHPELTGRENIYLKGAIMGMKHAETKRRFEEIVDFAEVERFLDTPVKRYSSGMYVKLGFSVAAHLNPEILIVDEVLAVGDAQFQRKCIAKMQSILSQEGRTILFVSHNLSLIRTLCNRAIILKGGQIMADGPCEQTVNQYVEMTENVSGGDLATRVDRKGGGKVRATKFEAVSDTGEGTRLITGHPVRFVVEMDQYLPEVNCVLLFFDKLATPVASFNSQFVSPQDGTHDFGSRSFVCEVPDLPLVAGRYRIGIQLSIADAIQDEILNVCTLEVERGNFQERPPAPWGGMGNVLIPHRWLLPKT
jgi:lipopolysaccharide transport system ATP-binding protein